MSMRAKRAALLVVAVVWLASLLWVGITLERGTWPVSRSSVWMDFLGIALLCAAVVADLECIPAALARWTRISLHPLRRNGHASTGKKEGA